MRTFIGVNLPTVQRTYRWYAPYYDRLFGALFDAGRRRAVRCAAQTGARRVLEVGVGTGLSLPYYPERCRVVGVDVSAEMLAVARRRAAHLPNVEALVQMDAEDLEFPDASFDAAVAMYVATVSPHPGRLLAEMARVCVPGGDVVVVNHFASDHPLVRAAESALAPLGPLVGFRTALPLEALPEPAALERVAVEPVNALGLWKIVRYRRVPVAQFTGTPRAEAAARVDAP